MDTPDISSKACKRSSKLTRDQRLQILTLFRAGHSKKEISIILGVTIHQVKNTLRSGRVSPGKITGRKPTLGPEQVDELERFVQTSQETRQMSYLELAMNFPQWNVGQDAIRNALKRRGYCRRVMKPGSMMVETTKCSSPEMSVFIYLP
ncbi:hypothetical protein HI914_02268 [Erysiphe necator]|nr:hypothetical protein HI914_02268 [Erysiphe necator]